MGGLEEGPGHIAEVEAPAAAAAAGPALKPRESSSGTVLGLPAVEDEATQSAKAPESEGSLLVVATTDRC